MEQAVPPMGENAKVEDSDNYTMDRELGSGSFSKVRRRCVM